MVDQHPHRHQRRPARAHLRVQQQHERVRGQRRRQLAEVQLRLARPVRRLDQDPPRQAVWDDALEASFEGAAAAEDDDGGDGAAAGVVATTIIAFSSIVAIAAAAGVDVVVRVVGSVLDEKRRGASGVAAAQWGGDGVGLIVGVRGGGLNEEGGETVEVEDEILARDCWSEQNSMNANDLRLGGEDSDVRG